jgi:hypothetical protein
MGKSMARNTPASIYYILDSVLGLPAIIVAALLGGIGVGLAVGLIPIVEILLTEKPVSGERATVSSRTSSTWDSAGSHLAASHRRPDTDHAAGLTPFGRYVVRTAAESNPL